MMLVGGTKKQLALGDIVDSGGHGWWWVVEMLSYWR